MEGSGRFNLNLLDDPQGLQARVIELLHERCGCESLFDYKSCQTEVKASSVLLLLGTQVARNGQSPEICVILNKRSQNVRQPGDLCCPGGAVERRIDPFLAKMLSLPFSPLSRWPYWAAFRREQPEEARLMSLLLATGLRESWEEMRLNPFATKFLGPLPSQCLIVFRRVIHPMVAWMSHQKTFALNWEVESIVPIPLRCLIDPGNYACYHLNVPQHLEWRFQGRQHDYPCFRYRSGERTELLWGATCRIVTLLLEIVFGFLPPDFRTLPVVYGNLDDKYVNGGNGDGPGVHL